MVDQYARQVKQPQIARIFTSGSILRQCQGVQTLAIYTIGMRQTQLDQEKIAENVGSNMALVPDLHSNPYPAAYTLFIPVQVKLVRLRSQPGGHHILVAWRVIDPASHSGVRNLKWYSD
jgi:hypothetical protein